MTMHGVIARVIAGLRTARARLRLSQQDRPARPVDPTKVVHPWVMQELLALVRWQDRWGKASGSPHVSSSGQESVKSFSSALVRQDQLVEDLLAVAKVLRRERRDQADIVEYGPAVIARSQARGWALDLEIARVMAAIRRIAPNTPEPPPYDADRSVRQQMEENFIANALYDASRKRRFPDLKPRS